MRKKLKGEQFTDFARDYRTGTGDPGWEPSRTIRLFGGIVARVVVVEGEAAWQVRVPAPPLRSFVDAYVGYRTRQPYGIHRGLPSGSMTFIVSLGDDIHIVRQVDPRQPPASYGCVVGGLHIAPAVIARGGLEEGVAIELNPLGSRALLGIPAGELANLTVEGEEVVGRRIGEELRDRLDVRSSWSQRFDVVDDILTRLLDADAVVASPLQEAWRLLDASGGNMAVGRVAQRVGWSRRHLTSQFSREFGLPPKAAARAIRLGHVVAYLRCNANRDLARAAAACGYYDQPHLTREFAAMADSTPTTWLTEEFPSIQDMISGAGDDGVVATTRGDRGG